MYFYNLTLRISTGKHQNGTADLCYDLLLAVTTLN
jgi:hypothetical protein